MGTRTKLIAGNWKMFTNTAVARQLAGAVVQGLGKETRVQVALCPPFTYLSVVSSLLRGTAVALGAQNVYPEREGAFTGEISPAMLLDVGCKYVIIGHSERRQVLGETDAFINRKVKAALEAGLYVILCVGETQAERESLQMEEVFERQTVGALDGVPSSLLPRLVVAYEPVWAIGTGKTATPDQAQDAHVLLRKYMAKMFGEEPAQALPILYGGSVKPENIVALMQKPDVDGALVGGASLKVDQFLTIIRAAL